MSMMIIGCCCCGLADLLLLLFTTASRQRQNLEPVGSSLAEQPRNNSIRSVKTEEYESKIYELSNQVKLLRNRLLEIEHHKDTSIEQQLIELKAENTRLHRENKTLRARIHELEQLGRRGSADNCDLVSVKSMGNMHNKLKRSAGEGILTNRQSSSKAENSTTTHLLRQLLAECNEPSQCGTTMRNEKIKDDFYQFKNSADCFEPWLGELPKQLKIRLKRCLTREKELLWLNANVQLGTICPYHPSLNDPPHFSRIVLVLTNVGTLPLRSISIEPIYGKDISLLRKGRDPSTSTVKSQQRKWSYAGELSSNEQFRQQVQVIVNNIDFRCVQLQITYEVMGQVYQQLLIAPLSKIKLFRALPYTSPPPKAQRIQRVFEFEKKILSEVGKLASLCGQVLEGKDKGGNRRYFWKLSLLERNFWIEGSAVEQKIMLAVNFQSDRPLAEKILDEYVFLFQKL